MNPDLIWSASEQGTPDWFADRLGVPTGSRAKDEFGTPLKRLRYLADLAAETITGEWHEIRAYQLDHGRQWEPVARSEYSLLHGVTVTIPGFCWIPGRTQGCSLDGIVVGGGIIEAKCPVDAAKHVQRIQQGFDPKEIGDQVQWNLWTTSAPWCDCISYHHKFPPASRLYVQRMYPDPKWQAKAEKEHPKFLDDLYELIERLR